MIFLKCYPLLSGEKVTFSILPHNTSTSFVLLSVNLSPRHLQEKLKRMLHNRHISIPFPLPLDINDVTVNSWSAPIHREIPGAKIISGIFSIFASFALYGVGGAWLKRLPRVAFQSFSNLIRIFKQ